MKNLENVPELGQYMPEIKGLVDYFTQKLDINAVGIILFGSVIRGTGQGESSDIDVVVYCRDFCRENADKFIQLIENYGGDFSDKPPIFLEDFISPRIEFFYKQGRQLFDINIFPCWLPGYEGREFNVIHDSLDVVIGAMYEKAVLVYGKVPFEGLLQDEFLPFYSEDLRIKRMCLLKSRISAELQKIKAIKEFGDALFLIYKMRRYLIKWLFINARKYPIDLDRYLEQQLSEDLRLERSQIDSLLLKANSLQLAYNNFVNFANFILGN